MKSEAERNKERDADALFNDMAHELVRKVLDIAEDRLLEGQIEDPVEVEEYLCRAYIEQVASIINGASWFMQNDATNGSEIFLLKCLGAFSDKPHPFRRRLTATKLRACGNQLSFRTATYFRRYPEILTQRYIEELHKPNNEVLIGAGHNGIFHLAVASLPGVQEQINRELRRRGLPYDAAKVPTLHLARRMRALGGQARLIGRA